MNNHQPLKGLLLLVLSIFSLGSLTVFAQTVGFEKKSISVKVDTLDKIVHATVRVSEVPKQGEEIVVKITDTKTGSAGNQDYQFSEERIVFSSDGSKYKSIPILIKGDQVLEPDETIILKMELLPDKSKSSQDSLDASSSQLEITIMDLESNYDPRYRFGIGASFDLLDGLSQTDLYADLNIFLPNLEGSRWGLEAGWYRGKTFSQLDTILREYSRVLPWSGSDTTTLQIRDKFNDTFSQSFNNFGFFAAPFLRLGSKPTGPEYTRVYLETRFSYIKRKIRNKSIYLPIVSDTIGSIPVTDAEKFPQSALPDSLVSNWTLHEAYFGVGATLHHVSKQFDFRLTPGFGLVSNSTKSGYCGYYLIKFKLIEKKFGFKVGGELRGTLPNAPPFVTIYLAKEFSIKKLSKFIF